MEYQKFNFSKSVCRLTWWWKMQKTILPPKFFLNTSAVDPAALSATSNIFSGSSHFLATRPNSAIFLSCPFLTRGSTLAVLSNLSATHIFWVARTEVLSFSAVRLPSCLFPGYHQLFEHTNLVSTNLLVNLLSASGIWCGSATQAVEVQSTPSNYPPTLIQHQPT